MGILLLVVGLAVLVGSPRLVPFIMSRDSAPDRFGGSVRAWVPVVGLGVAFTISGVLILAGVWDG